MDLQKLIKYADSEENSKIRAEIWGDFVGWTSRRKGENGFLINQLNKHEVNKVLDVTLGDGADAIYLIEQGFDVSGNEVDDAFREKAIENVKKSGFDLSLTDLDWRELSKTYSADSYDAIICLGNSLTCIFGRENQLKSLREFYKILKPGGILLIDERNYQNMLDNRGKVLRDEFPSTGKYVYTGSIKLKILHLDENFMLATYVKNNRNIEAYYKVYPFKKGEVQEILVETGFSKIEKFSDYEPGENLEADFYQYVCVK